jgi:DNA uptake protein ComE-like DNA-binding protein
MKQAPKIVNLGMVLVLTACGGGEEAPEAAPAEAPPAAAPAPAPADGLVDPNTAPEAQLRTIEGVDSATAAAIVAGRPFENMVAVDALLPAGYNDQQRDQVFGRLWHPLDLNSASEEEIMLIPGVGANLAEEFEEYRPYDSIERFRREIGKYVDEAEVARLEQYVTIR